MKEWGRCTSYILNNAKFYNLVEGATKFPGFKEVVERKWMVDNGLVRRRKLEKRSFNRETSLSFHKLNSPFVTTEAGNKVSSKAIHGKGFVAVP